MDDLPGAYRSHTPSISSTKSEEDIAPPQPASQRLETLSLSFSGLPRELSLTVDAGPGCGGIAWPAGMVLAGYLIQRADIRAGVWRGKTILELGSGTGLVGLVAGILEPKADVWVSDQEMLLQLMRDNINGNGLGNAHAVELNWGEPVPAELPQPDILLLADCVYFEPCFPLLVTTLAHLTASGQVGEILFCWKRRRKADKRFFGMLRKVFDYEEVQDDPDREVYTREGVQLLSLRRKERINWPPADATAKH